MTHEQFQNRNKFVTCAMSPIGLSDFMGQNTTQQHLDVNHVRILFYCNQTHFVVLTIFKSLISKTSRSHFKTQKKTCENSYLIGLLVTRTKKLGFFQRSNPFIKFSWRTRWKQRHMDCTICTSVTALSNSDASALSPACVAQTISPTKEHIVT